MAGDFSLGRVVGGLAVAVGLVTGLGTIVGWIASQDLIGTATITLTAAGALYLALIIVGSIWELIGGDDWRQRGMGAAASAFMVVTLLYAVTVGREVFLLRIMGGAGLALRGCVGQHLPARGVQETEGKPENLP